MTEHGMIFNAEMVRALLHGRKTQTRRIIKPQPEVTLSGSLSGTWLSRPLNGLLLPKIEDIAIHCPFGAVGDRIWVREAFRVMGCATDVARLMYKASERNSFTESTRTVPVASCTKQPSQKWTPGIHMPRWASRIKLEITDVRVERLQDISEEDAKAEGLAEITKDGSLFKFGNPDRDGYPGTDDKGWPWTEWERNPVDAYCKLWQSIYGADSWQANP